MHQNGAGQYATVAVDKQTQRDMDTHEHDWKHNVPEEVITSVGKKVWFSALT